MELQDSIDESLTYLYNQLDEFENKPTTRKLFQTQQCNRIKPTFRPSLIDRATRKLPNFSTPMPNHDMYKTANGFPSDISFISGSNAIIIDSSHSQDRDDGFESSENNLKIAEEEEVYKTGEKLTLLKKNNQLDHTNVTNRTRRNRIFSRDEDEEVLCTKRSRPILESEEYVTDGLERPLKSKRTLGDEEVHLEKSGIPSEDLREGEKSKNYTQNNRSRSQKILDPTESENDEPNFESPSRNTRSLAVKNHLNSIEKSRIGSESQEEGKSANRTQNNRSRSRKLSEARGSDVDNPNHESPSRNTRSLAAANNISKIEKSRILTEDREEVEKSTNRTRNNRSRSRTKLELDERDKDASKAQNVTKDNKSRIAENKTSKIEQSRIASADREEEKSTNRTQNNRSRSRKLSEAPDSDVDNPNHESPSRNTRSLAAANNISKIEKSRILTEDREEVGKSTNRTRNNRSRSRTKLELDECDKDASKGQNVSKNNKSRIAENKTSQIERSRIASEDREEEKSTNRTRNNRSRSRVNLELDERDKDASKAQNVTKDNKSRIAENKTSKIEQSRIASADREEEKSTNRTQNNRSRSRKLSEAPDSDVDNPNHESPSRNTRSLAAANNISKIEKSRILTEDREEVGKSTNRTRNNRSRSRTKLELDECDKDASKGQNVSKNNKSRIAENKTSQIERSRIASEDREEEKSTNRTRNNRSRSRVNLELDERDKDASKAQNVTKDNKSRIAENKTSKIEQSRIASADREEEKSTNRTQTNRSRSRKLSEAPDSDVDNLNHESPSRNSRSLAAANKISKIEKSRILTEDREEVEKSTNRTRNNRSRSRTKLELDERDKDASKAQNVTKNNKSGIAENKTSRIERSRIASADREEEQSTNRTQNNDSEIDNPNLESPSRNTRSLASANDVSKVEKSRIHGGDQEEVERSTNRTRNNRSQSRAKLEFNECDKDVSKPQNATGNNRSRVAENKTSKITKSRIQSEDREKEKSTTPTKNNRSRLRKLSDSSQSDIDNLNLESPSRNTRRSADENNVNKIEKNRIPSEDRGKVEKSTNRPQNNRSQSRPNLELDECHKDVSESQNVNRNNKSRIPENKTSEINKSRIQSEVREEAEKFTNGTQNNRSRSRKLSEAPDSDVDNLNFESPSRNARSLAAENHLSKIQKSRILSEDLEGVEKSTNRTRNNRSRSRANLELKKYDKDASKLQNATRNKSLNPESKTCKIQKSRFPSEDREEEKSTHCTQSHRSRSRKILNSSESDIDNSNVESPSRSTRSLAAESHFSKIEKSRNLNEDREEVEKSINCTQNNIFRSRIKLTFDEIDSDVSNSENDLINKSKLPHDSYYSSIKNTRKTPPNKKLTRSFGTNTTNILPINHENEERPRQTNAQKLTHSIACQADDVLETSRVEPNKRSLSNVLARLHGEKNDPKRKSILKVANNSPAIDNQRMVTFSEKANSSSSSAFKRQSTSTPNDINIKRKARGLFNDISHSSDADCSSSFISKPENSKIHQLFEYVDDSQPWRFDASFTQLPKNDLTWKANTVVKAKRRKSRKTFASKKAGKLKDLDTSEEDDVDAVNSDASEEEADTLLSFNEFIVFKERNNPPSNLDLNQSANRSSQASANSSQKQRDIADNQYVTFNSHKGKKLMRFRETSTSPQRSPVRKSYKEQNSQYGKSLDISGVAEFNGDDIPPVNNSEIRSLNRSSKVNRSHSLANDAPQIPNQDLDEDFMDSITSSALENNVRIISNHLLIPNDDGNRSTSKKSNSRKGIGDDENETLGLPVEQLDNDGFVVPDKPVPKRRKQSKAATEDNSALITSSASESTFTSEDGVRRSTRVRRPPKPRGTGFFTLNAKDLAFHTNVRKVSSSSTFEKRLSKTSSIGSRRTTTSKPLEVIPEDTSSTFSNLPLLEEATGSVEEPPSESTETESVASVVLPKRKRGRPRTKKQKSNVLAGKVSKRSTNINSLSMNTTIEVTDGTSKRLISWVANNTKTDFEDSDTSASIGFAHPIYQNAVGVLDIQPGKSKKLTIAKKYSMYFAVILGEAEVQVAGSHCIVKDNGTFYVPKGTPYCINNNSETNPLKLNFFRTIEQ